MHRYACVVDVDWAGPRPGRSEGGICPRLLLHCNNHKSQMYLFTVSDSSHSQHDTKTLDACVIVWGIKTMSALSKYCKSILSSPAADVLWGGLYMVWNNAEVGAQCQSNIHMNAGPEVSQQDIVQSIRLPLLTHLLPIIVPAAMSSSGKQAVHMMDKKNFFYWSLVWHQH